MRQDNGVSLARGGEELETVSTLFTHVNPTNGHNIYITKFKIRIFARISDWVVLKQWAIDILLQPHKLQQVWLRYIGL